MFLQISPSFREQQIAIATYIDTIGLIHSTQGIGLNISLCKLL